MRISLKQTTRAKAWSNFKSLAATLVFVWFFTHHIAQATVVPSQSMEPTILVGDHFFLDKVAFPANYPDSIEKYLPQRKISRGDIVAFWSPEESDLRLVKRVIGLPGETIEVHSGDVYIGGKKLNEPYVVHAFQGRSGSIQEMAPITLPPDRFFMMGDNRDESRDSRYFGTVPRESLIGRPLFVYWSFEGPYPDRNATVGEWAEHFASVAVHFFTQTRWGRTGKPLR